jgi:carbon storage regulator CsrA
MTLTRKKGEKIILQCADGLITITVVEADRGQTRINVKAPMEVKIDREEVYLDKLEGT